MESALHNCVEVEHQQFAAKHEQIDYGETVSRMQTFADSSKSEVIYAVDEQGNEIALALVIEGPFVKDHDESVQDENAVDVEGNSNSNPCIWVAGQEECVITEDHKAVSEEVQNEINKSDLSNGCAAESSDVIKIYKVDHATRKTLKKLKLDVTKRQPGKNVKMCIKSSNEGKVFEMPKIKLVKKKIKKRLTDKTFAMPSTIRTLTLKGK